MLPKYIDINKKTFNIEMKTSIKYFLNLLEIQCNINIIIIPAIPIARFRKFFSKSDFIEANVNSVIEI